MPFEELGLSTPILQAVDDAGYSEPTPIQQRAIPYVLQGRDVLGCAQTGTGKTAGFTLPMIDILSQGRARARMPRSLILEPTRELAAQVAENFDVYGKYHKLNMALLIGGVSFVDQSRIIDRGADVLIATPGRLLDLMQQMLNTNHKVQSPLRCVRRSGRNHRLRVDCAAHLEAPVREAADNGVVLVHAPALSQACAGMPPLRIQVRTAEGAIRPTMLARTRMRRDVQVEARGQGGSELRVVEVMNGLARGTQPGASSFASGAANGRFVLL